MDKVSYVGNADVNAIDNLYNQYRQDPESVDIGWKKFFEGFEFAQTSYDESGVIPENFQKEFEHDLKKEPEIQNKRYSLSFHKYMNLGLYEV